MNCANVCAIIIISSTVTAYANNMLVLGHAYYFVFESSAPKSSYTDQSYLKALGGGLYQTSSINGNGGVTTYNGQFQNQHYELTSASSTK